MPGITSTTQEAIAAAFTEWDRRYREEPERFQAEAERLLRGTPESYGEACAPYFISILTQVKAKAEAIAPPPNKLIKTTAVIVLVMLVLAGCKSTPDDFGDLEKLYEEAKEKLIPTPPDSENWRQGPHKIEVPKLANWFFELEVKDQDMSRPNGKPERITVGFKLSGIDYKVYCMIDNRDGVRARAKGDVNLHVTSFVHAPITWKPGQPSAMLRWEAKDGVLNFTVNDGPTRKHPFKIGDAVLKAVYISPDAGRPAGCKWRAGTVDELQSERESE